MGTRTHRMRVKHGLLIGLLTAGACFAVTALPTFSGESRPAPSGQTQTESGATGSHQPAEKPAAVSGAPSMTIYIHPQTGAILKEPAPGTIPLQLPSEPQNAFSTSDQGLVEVPSAVRGGGVTVNLQGRFQSPLIATTDANGKVKMQHLHEMPGTDDKR